jgi:peptidoglycan hydrolase CwlO-like protein
MSNLIERLRYLAGTSSRQLDPSVQMLNEAADRIEQLEDQLSFMTKECQNFEAEVERLQPNSESIQFMEDQNLKLQAEVERLRGALKWIRENVKVSADRALAAVQEKGDE